MKKIKRFIAEILCPEEMLDHEKILQLRSFIEQDHRWLGEFKEIEAYTDRLRIVFKDLNRGVGDPYEDSKWRIDVSGFREQLRRGEHLQ